MIQPLHPVPDPWGIVLAGGAGRRLEPLTRTLMETPLPKQFCNFGKTRSLLQETLARIAPIIPPERMVVVANASHQRLAKAQLSRTPGVTLVEQPEDRGTAPGVLLPLMHVARREPESTVILFPTDHGIDDLQVFHQGLRTACRAVETTPSLVVVGGVKAVFANPDYGWILPGKALGIDHGFGLRRVNRFVEKPSRNRAEKLYNQGGLWSTFIVAAKARTLLRLFQAELPEHVCFFKKYVDMEERKGASWLADNYHGVPRANLSSDVLGSATDLAVLAWPEDLGWTDLGTPARLVQWLSRPKGQGEGAGIGNTSPGLSTEATASRYLSEGGMDSVSAAGILRSISCQSVTLSSGTSGSGPDNMAGSTIRAGDTGELATAGGERGGGSTCISFK